ncbi:hypothetical protein [Planktotalea sp.]|uniref:hypothetical protein n=1 Tax=Planktotalea sp. TaxID=2029877 RepID=UPI0035C8749E
MALIECRECNSKISDHAEACPSCGAPMSVASETAAAGAQLRTVQLTSKKLKFHTLISIALMIIGAVWFFSTSKPEEIGTPYGFFMFVAGGIFFIITRIRVWWHHG